MSIGLPHRHIQTARDLGFTVLVNIKNSLAFVKHCRTSLKDH